MSSKTLAVAIVALTLSLPAAPAAAAAKKKDDSSRTIVRTEIIDGVPRRVVTRITVKRRSYLDGGTEVIPGSRPSYVTSPGGYSAFDNYNRAGAWPTWTSYPLYGPFELPGNPRNVW